jgi:hypothetical protein
MCVYLYIYIYLIYGSALLEMSCGAQKIARKHHAPLVETSFRPLGEQSFDPLTFADHHPISG